MADLDELLRPDICHAAAHAVEPPDFTTIERRGMRHRRRRTALTAAAVAAAVVLAVSAVAVSLSGDEIRVQPAEESTSSPSPTATTTRPTQTADSSTQLRPDSPGPVVGMRQQRDGRDATFGGIDILDVGASRRPGWTIELRAAPPLASTLDPARRIIEHGVVVDADGDRVADCHIGINTDAPTPGHLRVWVKNLDTGVSDERIGPPYGIPIDFVHPSEGEDLGSDRLVHFFFLSKETEPCDRPGPDAAFYAYASLAEQGRVTALDYAPDTAWLRFP